MPEIKSLDGTTTGVADPIDVVGDFLKFIRNEPMTEKELGVVAPALHSIRNGDNAV